MLRQCQFEYPSSGKLFICVDGPEVLVYSGNDDGPLWKAFCEERVVGVGVTREEVYLLDDTGRLIKKRLINGELLDEDSLDFRPTGLLISEDETMAVVGEERLFVRASGAEPMAVGISGVSAARFGPTGGSIGLGTKTGEFHAVDTTTGDAWGRVDLGEAVTGVAWSAQQVWLVTAGSCLFTVSGDGGQILETMAVDGQIGGLTCSTDGAIVALLIDSTVVSVYEWLNKSLAGRITLDRGVQSLAFGPSSWLGLALDDGDANRVDLFTGQMTRTQAHEGRGQNAWPINVDVNSALLRGASTSLRAGGAPIAVQVRSAAIDDKKSNRMVWFVLALMIALAGFSVVGMLCCGVSFLPKGPKYYFGF
jgi:hypothetical protein